MRHRHGATIRGIVAGLTFIGLAGCPAKRPEPVAHEPEERTGSVTVWTDRFEVFFEHRPFVANVPTTVACHVTDLESLEPRREGPVRFTLVLGEGPPIEHAEAAPERAGIYSPKLAFPKTGAWKITLRIPTAKGEAVVELPPEMVFATKEEGQKALPEAPEGIPFLKEQQWKVLTKSEPARTRRLVEHLRLPAHVAARPGSRAVVTPPLAGRLLAPAGRSLPGIGDRVEAGTVVALVQPPLDELTVRLAEAETNVARAKLAADQAERSAVRVRELVAKEARSARELEEAEFAVSSAKAAHEAALTVQAAWRKAGASFVGSGDGRLSALELRAPITGAVTEVRGTVGAFVPVDLGILTILDTTRVLIEAHVAEADLGRVSTGSLVAAYEGPTGLVAIAEPRGKLVLRGLEVDAATRTLPLVFDLANEEWLPIGLALNVLVETARATEALALPESAIVEEEGRPIVFVHVSGETFEKRSVALGLREEGFVQVLSGVAAGERVVTKEAYAIRLASVSSAIPAHGHAH